MQHNTCRDCYCAHEAVMHHVNKKDIYIEQANVSDYRPARKNETKLKKTIKRPLDFELRKVNQDILKSVSELDERPYVVGFAALRQMILLRMPKRNLKTKASILVVLMMFEVPLIWIQMIMR